MILSGRPKKILLKILARLVSEDRGYHTPCWLWTGPTSGDTGRGRDYPRMCLDGATVAVHRTIFTLFHGPIPPRKHIDHKCGVRLCCRPDHLEMVTHKENQKRRDAARKACDD